MSWRCLDSCVSRDGVSRRATADTSLTPHAVTPERRGPRGRGARSTNLVLDQRHQSNKDHRSLYFCWGGVNFIAIFDQSRRSALGVGLVAAHRSQHRLAARARSRTSAQSTDRHYDLRLRLSGDRHERTSIQHKQDQTTAVRSRFDLWMRVTAPAREGRKEGAKNIKTYWHISRFTYGKLL